ncbi:MAG TPA: hydrogenase maturation nickel metallochaperone HypA [Vicinamibacterales bacterium]|jgi:hydrogenase nickel incorporation protein HypA/HybF
MHELSIAQSIVDSVREHAAGHVGRRVLRVGVRVGEISGVNADALEFCFGMTVKDTDLDGVGLDLERVAVRYRCLDCAHEFPPVDFRAVCPSCRSEMASMIAGEELALSYLELE